MQKPSIYLDSSFISAYWYYGTSSEGQQRRMRTRDWWKAERQHFQLWGSAFVERELRAGTYRRQEECVRMSRSLRSCPMVGEVKRLWHDLLETKLIPANKPVDAWHLALAACHGMDYLLTWNYAHLANSTAQARLDQLCRDRHWRSPLLVSPESIPQVRFGQSIVRGE